MGIPKKGSRKVTYSKEGDPDRTFRYLVKETHIPEHLDQKELSITVQEDAERPGNVLQCRWPYGAEVTPTVVRSLIEDGFKAGWDPNKRGPAVILT